MAAKSERLWRSKFHYISITFHRFFSISRCQFDKVRSSSKQVIGSLAPSKFDCKVIFPDNSNVPNSVESLGVGLVQIEMIRILGCTCFLDDQNSFEVPTKLNA